MPRLESKLTNQKFINKILTPQEQVQYEQLKNKKRKLEYLSGRISAKEAYLKAIQTGVGVIGFQDIEVLSLPNRAPFLNKKNTSLSISHDEEYTIAMVIVGESNE